LRDGDDAGASHDSYRGHRTE
jgi:hypothetical protein